MAVREDGTTRSIKNELNKLCILNANYCRCSVALLGRATDFLHYPYQGTLSVPGTEPLLVK